jgi:uncharacterized protein (DUF952 family)
MTSASDVLHISTPDAWAAAQQAGEVRAPSLATEGFIHCSTRDQLAVTLDRHFRGSGPLVALVLDAERLGDALHWDESYPGEHFPHVYGPIPLAAVLAVEQVSPPAG